MASAHNLQSNKLSPETIKQKALIYDRSSDTRLWERIWFNVSRLKSTAFVFNMTSLQRSTCSKSIRLITHRSNTYPSSTFTVHHHHYGTFPISALKDTYRGHKRKRPAGRGPNQKVGLGDKGSRVRQGNRRQSHRGFEGGQTPLHIASPRIGWHRWDHANALNWLDLDKIETWITRGALNKNKVITMHDLVKSRCFPKKENLKYGLALINNAKEYEVFPYKINIEVTFVTPATKQAIEAAGGTVRLRYYEMANLRHHLYPHQFEFVPKHGYNELDTLPRPRWRHYFPDYPQLPILDDLQYLGKYQVHPALLPKNIEDEEELKQQEEKLKLAKKRYPKPLLRRPTDLKTKLFKWSKPN
eukprot:787044_1